MKETGETNFLIKIKAKRVQHSIHFDPDVWEYLESLKDMGFNTVSNAINSIVKEYKKTGGFKPTFNINQDLDKRLEKIEKIEMKLYNKLENLLKSEVQGNLPDYNKKEKQILDSLNLGNNLGFDEITDLTGLHDYEVMFILSKLYQRNKLIIDDNWRIKLI